MILDRKRRMPLLKIRPRSCRRKCSRSSVCRIATGCSGGLATAFLSGARSTRVARAPTCTGRSNRISQWQFLPFRLSRFPKVAAANLGGTTLLSGNISPMLLRDGSEEEIKETARECLETFGPCAGLLLDSANVCPARHFQVFRQSWMRPRKLTWKTEGCCNELTTTVTLCPESQNPRPSTGHNAPCHGLLLAEVLGWRIES